MSQITVRYNRTKLLHVVGGVLDTNHAIVEGVIGLKNCIFETLK